jgi:hypothetical protein
MNLGDEVTWEARHLFKTRRLTPCITEYEQPHRFVDEMGSGTFRIGCGHEGASSQARAACVRSTVLPWSRSEHLANDLDSIAAARPDRLNWGSDSAARSHQHVHGHPNREYVESAGSATEWHCC